MATYEITADERSYLPDRDAYAVTVRVGCDGTDLGLWQTWVSGIAEMQVDDHAQTSITKLQRRRIAAELLGKAIEEQARAGQLRNVWQLDVTVVEETSAQAIIEYATRGMSPPQDFRAGDVIHSFEV